MKLRNCYKIILCVALAVAMAFSAAACNPTTSGDTIDGIDMIATLSLDVGKEYTIQASLLPFGAQATITWKSSDTSVATVDSNGKVKAIAAGQTTIGARAGGKRADCVVTVTDPSQGDKPVTNVKLNIGVLRLDVGGTAELTATITPSNATDQRLTWTSDNEAVATVSQTGIVDAVSPGTAIITVASTNNHTAKCIVRVAGGDDDVETSSTLYVRKIAGLEDRDDFIMGMDASAVISLENAGVVYRDFDGTEKDVFEILHDNGITDIRIRIWNNPYQNGHYGDVAYSYGGGNCDVENAVAIAKRCAKFDLGVIVDFHYSDFWADPGKQQLPKAWAGYTTSQVEQAIYDFTKESLQKIDATGVKITMVQIGNETTGSMAGSNDWTVISKYMNAGSKAVREVTGAVSAGGAKVALHFTNPEGQNYLTKAANVSSVDYDVFGSSYYPAWHGTLSNLSSELQKVHTKYGKEVMVLETSYPFTLEDFDGTGNTAVNNPESIRPFTVQGQANQILDVIETIANLGDYGLGVCYWEGTWIAPADNREDTLDLCNRYGCGWATAKAGPSSIGGDGYQANDVSAAGGVVIDNQAFFRSSDGQALESLKVFALAKVGQNADPIADYIYETELYYTVNEGTIEIPEKVTLVLNTGAVREQEALWEIDESVVATWINNVNDYVITGTTIYGGEAICRIYVQNKNLLTNGGFEDTEGYGSVDDFIDVPSPWQQRHTGGNVLQLYVSADSGNAKMGTNSFHFWDDADLYFDLYQTISSADITSALNQYGAGTFTFSIDFQGGDCGTHSIYAYAKITYKNGSTSNIIYGSNIWATGWLQWSRTSVDVSIDSNVASVEVGVHVTAEAGGWGNFDNAQFFFKG